MIDPNLKENWEKPLWVVYGYKYYPQMICCTIKLNSGQPTIWGYSVYKNSGGFRTLGVALETWISENTGQYKMDPSFFDNFSDASGVIEKQLKPSKKALGEL